MNIDEILKAMVEKNASDIHFKVGNTPIMRINKDLVNWGDKKLNSEETEAIARNIMTSGQWQTFEYNKEIDFAYTLAGVGRFRTNVFIQRGSIGLVMRSVKTTILNFEQLGLPTILKEVSLVERGIIILSGATGSGKSTTLAAMIDHINRTRRRHIITIEDPIEFLHQDLSSIVNQREVGIDTMTFQTALKHVLRQDPDVMLIGEMRDQQSFTASLSASETGHVVLTTVHADSSVQSIERILDFFSSPEQREQARLQLSTNIAAIICQRLIPNIDKQGLVPAVEILRGTPIVKKFIRENKFDKIYKAIETGKEDGMQTFNQSILKLIQENKISEEDGLSKASNPEALRMNLKGIFLDDSKGILR
ncbi:MAG: PilT/PilU family type 4a pilus ATPase [Candidatus Aureabacteria bacterium]|nr:PilT/PilU family type 4a pilus ATPase [Candidatus Auribacterota bacterium]